LDFYSICFVVPTGFIYPIAAHWVATKNGWLSRLGFDDFAFSGVVHAMSGATCLAAAWMTGPRLDRYESGGQRRVVISPHSVPVFLKLKFAIY
jgi:Amt family ammonium transporter